jgi:hypothetical protein
MNAEASAHVNVFELLLLFSSFPEEDGEGKQYKIGPGR